MKLQARITRTYRRDPIAGGPRAGASAFLPGVLLAVLAITLMAGAQAFGETGQQVLMKAFGADHRVTYRGISDSETRFQGKIMHESAVVLHKKPSFHRIEYTDAPLAGMVVACNGRVQWRIDPRHRTLYRSQAVCPHDPRKLTALLANYRVELLKTEAVAGRKAYVVSLTPRDSNRGRRKIWVDAGCGVQLGSEEYDAGGKLVSRSMFSRIEFPKDLPESAFAEPKAKGYRLIVSGPGSSSVSSLSRELGFKVLTPGYIPKGYLLVRAFRDTCPCKCGAKTAHLRYGDGLSSISMMECPACGKMAASCPMPSRCRASDYGAAGVATISRNGLTISVVGGLAMGELKKIAESMR